MSPAQLLTKKGLKQCPRFTPNVLWWGIYSRHQGLRSLPPVDSLQEEMSCGLSHVIQKVLTVATVDDTHFPPSAFWTESGWVDDSYPTPPSGLDLGSNYQGLKLCILCLLTPVKYLKKINASPKIFFSLEILNTLKNNSWGILKLDMTE